MNNVINKFELSYDTMLSACCELSRLHTSCLVFDENQKGYVSKKICYEQKDVESVKKRLKELSELIELSKHTIEKLE